MKALLVNPWIYDFAAYNFWVRPLGLYRVAEWLHERGVDVRLVDAMSPFSAPGRFKRTVVPRPLVLADFPRNYARYGIDVSAFKERVLAEAPFDAVFITSVMSYWYPGVALCAWILKGMYPKVPVFLGGIYASLWKEHAQAIAWVDHVVKGPIEYATEEICDILGLPARPVRGKRRWFQLGLWDGSSYGAVRLATGCPFNCTYCASNRIAKGFRPREIEDVILELEALYSYGVREIAFYDDALLVDFDSRLRKVLDTVLARGLDLRFHCPNGLHARFMDKTVSRYLKMANFKTIRLSLETVSRERQVATGGKVSNTHLDQAVENLIEAGVPRECIGVYLLAGLPGQGADDVMDGIRFVRSLGVRPFIAEFSPIPGTVEWSRLVHAGIIDPANVDPILTNNSVFPRLFSAIGEEHWKEIKRLQKEG